MSKILLTGMSPMPFENDKKVYGTGIRTWQFVLPLLLKGHEICLCNYAIPSAYPEDFKSKYLKDFNNSGNTFEYNILKKEDFENTDILTDIYKRFKPDCVIGCTFYPSYIASLMFSRMDKTSFTPFWADLFGHVMAEAQARAFMDDNDGCLLHYWNSEYDIITAADFFSCVSGRQEYSLIGELGAVGRLNKKTSGYNFSTTIPCGMPVEEYVHEKDVIRNRDNIKKGDFVILWTGGYNTWTDIDTLFDGVTAAMEKNARIKFVSTGGEIPEQDIKTYPRFLSKINSSEFRERFIMNGWIPGEDVPNYYLEADIGINIDKDIYEVKLGSKNRILDWMRAGLCVISSNVCELTEIIEREKIGFTFKPGDPEDLCKKILYAADNIDDVKKRGRSGKEYGLREFSFEKTTGILQGWAEKPGISPDRNIERKILFSREEAIKNLDRIVAGQKAMIEERDSRIRQLEGVLHKRSIYRFYSYIRMIFRKIFK